MTDLWVQLRVRVLEFRALGVGCFSFQIKHASRGGVGSGAWGPLETLNPLDPTTPRTRKTLDLQTRNPPNPIPP